MNQPDPGIHKRDPYRVEHLPIHRKLGWRRGTGSHYGLRQFGGGPGHRISDPRAGIQHWRQDFHDRRVCDPVRDIYQLGAGADLLGDEDAGVGVNERELAQ